MNPSSNKITENSKLRNVILVLFGVIVVIHWVAFDEGIRPPWRIIALEFFGTFAVGIILGILISNLYLKNRLRDGRILVIGDDLSRLSGLIFITLLIYIPLVSSFLCVAMEPKQLKSCLSMAHHLGYLGAGLLSGFLVWLFIWMTLIEMAKSGDVLLETHKVGWTKTKMLFASLSIIQIIAFTVIAIYSMSWYLE